MNSYEVNYYFEPLGEVFKFFCRAEDENHAIEQLMTAEPNGKLLCVGEIDDSYYHRIAAEMMLNISVPYVEWLDLDKPTSSSKTPA